MTRNTLAVHNGDCTVKRARSGLELPNDAPTYSEFAEFLGGSEYPTLWRPPFKLIGLSQEEDE